MNRNFFFFLFDCVLIKVCRHINHLLSQRCLLQRHDSLINVPEVQRLFAELKMVLELLKWVLFYISAHHFIGKESISELIVIASFFIKNRTIIIIICWCQRMTKMKCCLGEREKTLHHNIWLVNLLIQWTEIEMPVFVRGLRVTRNAELFGPIIRNGKLHMSYYFENYDR